MLDFVSLQKLLDDMVRDQTIVHQNYREKFALAHQTLVDWAAQWKVLVEKIGKSRTSWLLAEDLCEPFDCCYPLPSRPEQFTVVATDGSQIFPDRHELSTCHLINIGTVVLHYGTGERPLLTNHPRLFYKEDEIYREWNGWRVPVNADLISALRGAYEIQELSLAAEQAAHDHRQVVGLSDGTLILWILEGKPREFKKEILNFYLSSFEQLKSLCIPFFGYISHPTSADFVNVLRVALCPENPTNCDRCPYRNQQAELPCEPIAGVTDAVLFASILSPGERSSIFKSQSEILKLYGEHTVYFFYLNVGPEIVRIEIPKWVAKDVALLQRVHAMAHDQAQKGQGYPVSLSEAHEQAVIRSSEREQFYRLLENLYIQKGLEVNLSRKVLKKRNVSI
ncbi:MAG: DNA double-strand break repair nuclease NurA [Candidatus Vecturithrix sp.]|jgi:hypothetical protein|nr:DNA double-strand break repair nuclease NurA [Candidatus Vecturithrix sp.]